MEGMKIYRSPVVNTYIRRQPKHIPTYEAALVEEDSIQEIANWMRLPKVTPHKKGGWVLSNGTVEQRVQLNTVIVDRSQAMSVEDFTKEYKFWPEDLL